MSESFKQDIECIGDHCNFELCNRLDFLPVKCDFCRFNYCKDHYRFENKVLILNNFKFFFLFSITSHNCSKYEKPNEKESVIFKSAVNAFICSLNECASKDVIEFLCEFCKLNFCMKHRLQIDHLCANMPKPIETTKKEVKEFKFEMKQNVSEKNAGLAAKLLVMKLRQTAIGPPGLPEESKFYFFINYLDQIKKPFYFSIKWPIGKCIDFLFDKFTINKSSLSTTKLWMDTMQVDSSLTVEDFIKNFSLKPGTILDLKSI